jgi:hypothetical protein
MNFNTPKSIFLFNKNPTLTLTSNATTADYSNKIMYNHLCYYIYRCVNKNILIDAPFCYMILLHSIDDMKNKDIQFKSVYLKYFHTPPKHIATFYGKHHISDIEYIFHLFYRKNKKYQSYVFSRYGLLYLHNMTENEFIMKFQFLYNDTRKTLLHRDRVDHLYSNYLLANYWTTKKNNIEHTL